MRWVVDGPMMTTTTAMTNCDDDEDYHLFRYDMRSKHTNIYGTRTRNVYVCVSIFAPGRIVFHHDQMMTVKSNFAHAKRLYHLRSDAKEKDTLPTVTFGCVAAPRRIVIWISIPDHDILRTFIRNVQAHKLCTPTDPSACASTQRSTGLCVCGYFRTGLHSHTWHVCNCASMRLQLVSLAHALIRVVDVMFWWYVVPVLWVIRTLVCGFPRWPVTNVEWNVVGGCANSQIKSSPCLQLGFVLKQAFHSC